MNQDCLKLTTYFGERDRAGRNLLADELMRIYGAHRLRASVLLRGSEGFGRLHHLHTDRLLTLSEDLPVVSIAVDERARIERMLEPVLKVQRKGLITLERARLLSALTAQERLREQPHEATKLTVYLGRHDRIGDVPAFRALSALLFASGVAGATVLLGVDGTRGGSRSRARFFARNAAVPMVLIAVGAGERIARALGELAALPPDPVVTLERVRLCKRDGELIENPHELPATDAHGLGLWQKLTIYTSQAATHEGRPINQQIVRRLRESEAAGATSVRGVWGFHGDSAPHGDKLLQLRRHVPVVTTAIDTPERIASSFGIIDELTDEHGLVTSEMVPAMTALAAGDRRGGTRLAEHEY